MKINKLVSNLLDSNTFVLEKGENVLIIDCGCGLDRVKKNVGNKTVVGIFLTHGHYDHALYCNEYAKYFNCNIYANEKIKNTISNAVAFYSKDGSVINDFSHFKFLKEDCLIELDDFKVDCYSFAGHSPCCEGYVIENNLFAGDFLFAKSFGRVDFINSNKHDMLKSFEKVKDIEFDKVYSGHGEESTKEQQLRNLQLYRRFLTR